MTQPPVPDPTQARTGPPDAPQVTDPGAGAALLDELLAAMHRYVILPSPEATWAVALWIVATHAQPFWGHAPRLVIRAPEKRCGKSRLLDLVEATCHAPLITVNASPAAVYRSIGTGDPPTILLDEADTIFGGKAGESNEDLRGLLNAGHQRNRPALRYDASRQCVEQIPTFAMAALAGIGAMPDTIEDRAVVVRMRRRAPGETVAPFREKRDRAPLRLLAERIHEWARGNADVLLAAEPAMPVEDRAADTWEPLIAVADLAGDEWPDRARLAAVILTNERESNSTPGNGVRLLADCRTAFGDEPALHTTQLLDRLKEDPEAPWIDYGHNGLTAMKLGRLLGEYDIRSGNVRLPGTGQAKGYFRADFGDAWDRYCPTDPADPADDAGTGPLGEPSQPSQPHHPRSAPGRLEAWDGSSRPTPIGRPPTPTPDEAAPGGPWDGSSRPTRKAVPGLTSTDEAGTAGTAHPPTCIRCRQPMTYDDGTHTHPACA